MYYPLNEQSALEYVQQSPLMASFFGDKRNLRSKDLAEGNVNLIFRIYDADAPHTSLLVKQALPHARRYPSFKMPLERSRFEYDLLQIEGKYCPELVPKVYLYDEEMHLSIMEDLNRHVIMRDGLMRQQLYPNVARDMGIFMARTLFYTSDLYLSSADKKAMVPRFINPVLCKVQEDLVFTEPYMDHPNNRWTPLLNAQVAQIHEDDELRSEIFSLKEAYVSRAQSLIHNDLHTGSIMLNEHETKVIDPEFAFFGPMGHDIGSYIGNLVLSYAAQEYHAKDPAERTTYREWLLDVIAATWRQFEDEFSRLWETEGNAEWPSPRFRQQYVRGLLQDTAGFGAAEMMRRLIGMAHVPDLDDIPDDHARAKGESLALNIAHGWLMNRRGFTSIDDLVEIIRKSHPASTLA